MRELLSDRFRLIRFLSLGGLAAGWMLPPAGFSFSICIFYNLTGLPCPACGLTRSVSHIVQGDFLHSLIYHPAGVLVAAVMLLFVLSFFFKNSSAFYYRFEKYLIRFFYAAAGVVFIFGAVRAYMIVYEPEAAEIYFYTFHEKNIYFYFKEMIFHLLKARS
ncbi:MAG: DUF2752 domain-containing protein [Spirochaetia bacterium]|nr:DUF2752 domain-containing protein [Spirochaetia bacterium]